MWGGGYNNMAGGMGERATDNWIQQNIPGGLNSKCCFTGSLPDPGIQL